MTPYRVVFITVPNEHQADHLTKLLLEQKLAACVNRIKDIQSQYWWEGQIETAEEHLLIVKTRQDLLEPLLSTVKTHHSYAVPEIIALPILAGNPDYLEWINDSTTPA